MIEIKNCRTCAHCEIDSFGSSFDHCILCGDKCWVVRKYSNHLCDKNLSGWTPRTPTQYLLDHRFIITMIVVVFYITFASFLNN